MQGKHSALKEQVIVKQVHCKSNSSWRSILFTAFLILGGLNTGWAQATEPSGEKLPITLNSTLIAQLNEEPTRSEEVINTRPLGTHVYKTHTEIDTTEKFVAGDSVDVFLATLGDEGAHESPILRNIRVYSLGEPDELSPASQEAPHSENENHLTPTLYPMSEAGLVVNLAQMEKLRLAEAKGVLRLKRTENQDQGGMLGQLLHNFTSNLFQPLLLFFFMGFAIPLLKVPFEFPKALYQSLTLYLLVAIGWHGGELMAHQSSSELTIAGGLAFVGILANGLIGLLATKILAFFTPMRKIDTTTVGAYYGSDSAGTFVTCLGILASLGILHDSYMPVLLAVMEIPGCLVGLFLISFLRRKGMDGMGNMPGEPGYTKPATSEISAAEGGSGRILSWKVLHEVFLNPGLYLLFGGIIVGFISGCQALKDPHVVEGPNHLFIFIFKGALCLFLLEMGVTACRRLSDLKTAGWGFIAFGLLAPNLFATIGMLILHGYSFLIGHEFYLGTYALFAVLCGAASYIAVPAVQRLAIPEASPTLPLAASLGLTFTWNVTIGIPLYLEIAKSIISSMPIA